MHLAHIKKALEEGTTVGIKHHLRLDNPDRPEHDLPTDPMFLTWPCPAKIKEVNPCLKLEPTRRVGFNQLYTIIETEEPQSGWHLVEMPCWVDLDGQLVTSERLVPSKYIVEWDDKAATAWERKHDMLLDRLTNHAKRANAKVLEAELEAYEEEHADAIEAMSENFFEGADSVIDKGTLAYLLSLVHAEATRFDRLTRGEVLWKP